MLKAKDIMTKDVITITPPATVEKLARFARLLIEYKINGVPVVNNEKNLIGIVNENDLTSQNKRLHIPTIIRLFDAFIFLGSGRIEKEIKKWQQPRLARYVPKRLLQSQRRHLQMRSQLYLLKEK